MPEQPQYLAEFLTKELDGYARLVGANINASNSNCIAERDEDFELLIYRSLPRTIDQLVAEFYTQQGLETRSHTGSFQLIKDSRHIGFIVTTGRRDVGSLLVSVRWMV